MAKRSITTPTADDLADSGRLDVPGVYHVLVKSVKDMEMSNGDAGEGFTVEFQILAGPQQDRTTKQYLADGQPSHKDGGEFARKRQTVFLIAANVLTPVQLNGEAVEFDPEEAAGSQLVVKFRQGEYTNKKNEKAHSIELSSLDMYHVDDPRKPACDINAGALNLIDKKLRRDATFFAPLASSSSRSSKPAPPAQTFDSSDL
jgi:hypothetical protein